MSQDDKIIRYFAPAEMAALMRETGMITVLESGLADGKPVIHAALKVVNAQTGEQLPGGLPFSVVMFKNLREPGYSNIAIGTVVPVAELEVSLPRDYFNFCNQRFRFTRVFPIDDRSFVLQMDLFVRNATREYVKYSFGVWAALFSQVLFDLIGRGKESLVSAAEAYAERSDLTEQYVSTVVASDETAVEETAVASAPEPAGEASADTFVEEVVEDETKHEAAAIEPMVETTELTAESFTEEAMAEEPAAIEPVAEVPVAEVPVAEAVAETTEEPASEPVAPQSEVKEPVAV